uniref:BZIP domain-containing protein n=1 Tax=Panagrolaimus sp. PS1159 TaxID=55785 RepID=A0AC35GSR7_9BILA
MYQQTVTPQTKPRKKGGRRPKDETNDFQVLSEEDRLKRDQKRERNKKSAARSRQKQNNKIEGLKQEKEKLQQQNIQLQMREKILKEAMEKAYNLQSSLCCHPWIVQKGII